MIVIHQHTIDPVFSFSLVSAPPASLRLSNKSNLLSSSTKKTTKLDQSSYACFSERLTLSLLQARRVNDDRDSQDDENDDLEYARIRVGRRRKREKYYNDDDTLLDDSNKNSNSNSNSNNYRKRMSQGRSLDDVEEDLYDEVQFDDDNEYDDDDDEYDNDQEEYDGVIPNALLDQIDPDGAIDRIPQLLSDPQFYRDVAIVLVLFILYAFNRYSSPLYDIKDINSIDFSQFYN